MMKTRYSYFYAAILLVTASFTDTLFSQNTNNAKSVSVKEISYTKWNTPDGIPYLKGPGNNLGATSFEMLDTNRIAFLSAASNEIIISKTMDGTAFKRFTISSAPRDFVYDNGFFYVLFGQQVREYDENGKTINDFSFPNAYLGVERLARFNKETYLLLPSGNCAKIESAGQAVTPKEYEGWITSTGYFVSTKLNSDNAYSITIKPANGNSSAKEFTTDKKVSGVYVIGSTASRIVLEVQTFISESPIAVVRSIVTVELNKDMIGSVVISNKVPDCNYVHSNKTFSVSNDGTILNMITAPNGVHVFSLADSQTAQDYPADIKDMKYHYNDNLIKVDEK